MERGVQPQRRLPTDSNFFPHTRQLRIVIDSGVSMADLRARFLESKSL